MTGASRETIETVASDVGDIKRDVEQILPSLVDALKRNRYFDEMEKRLRRAERVAEAWRDLPLLVGVHDVILAMRATPNHDPVFVEQLSDVLYRSAGVEEFGLIGEEIDPTMLEIYSSEGTGPRIIIREVQRPGLRIGHSPIRKAIVSVTRQGDQQ
ncbi:hypothetical protein [Arthrobacter sp. OY3WO11]|uniref:hypothetical protein n=1 Tax=Arthrobacter sp. OY3WO11 TaxID=1835723 RepID=UPI0007CFD46B|nr:hypothetical protein [Arthrobacter sp. OY3WO11]OAD97730.1 hypothetical protein A6A22_20215 [Arthrobacter sp. OY3WO11]